MSSIQLRDGSCQRPSLKPMGEVRSQASLLVIDGSIALGRAFHHRNEGSFRKSFSDLVTLGRSFRLSIKSDKLIQNP
jgi:hypothetical protein